MSGVCKDCALAELSSDILFVALWAVISGEDSWTGVEVFGWAKPETEERNADRKEWADLNSFVCMESASTLNGRTSCERHCYISDLAGQSTQTMLRRVRGHGGIENKLHWSLDVTFREDILRNRIGHSSENLSRIR